MISESIGQFLRARIKKLSMKRVALRRPFRAAQTLTGILVATLCLVSVPQAIAEVSNTTISAVGVGPQYDSVCGFKCMLIAFNSAPTGSPCAMDSGWHYVIDISTAEGRVTAATVLAAKASGSRVEAHGAGTCINSNRIERLSNFIMK